MKTEITEEHGAEPERYLDAVDFPIGVIVRGNNGALYLRSFDEGGDAAWVLFADTVGGWPVRDTKYIDGYPVILKSATVVRK